MPRPPKLTALINEEVYNEACADLGLTTPPRVRFAQASGHTMLGEAGPQGITICLGNYNHLVERLPHVHRQVARTILHELRHHFQFQTWPAGKWATDLARPYASQECELDANEWADENLHRYRRIVRVFRHHFTRLPG